MSRADVIIVFTFFTIWGIIAGLFNMNNDTHMVEGKSKNSQMVASYSDVDIYTDKDTKLQYLVFENTSGGIYVTPRLDDSGKQMKGE